MLEVTKLPEYVKGLLKGIPKVYVGDIPSLTEEGIGISLEEGFDNQRYFGQGTVFKPIIRITIRSQNYAEGMNKAKEILSVLDKYNDNNILHCLAGASPFYLGKTEQKLHEIQVVFYITLI